MQDYRTVHISGKIPSFKVIKIIDNLDRESIFLDQHFTPQGILDILPCLIKSDIMLLWIDSRILSESLKILAKYLKSKQIIMLPEELPADKAKILAENLAPGVALGMPDSMEPGVASQLASALKPNTIVYLNSKMSEEETKLILFNPQIIAKKWNAAYEITFAEKVLFYNPNNIFALLKIVSAALKGAEIPSLSINAIGTEFKSLDEKIASLNRKVLKINPSNADALVYLGRLYERNQIKEEKDDFDSNMEPIESDEKSVLNPENLTINFGYGLFECRPGFTKSSCAGPMSLRNESDRMEATFLLKEIKKIGVIDDYSFITTTKNNYQRAEWLYKKALRVNPKHADAFFHLGKLYENELTEPNFNHSRYGVTWFYQQALASNRNHAKALSRLRRLNENEFKLGDKIMHYWMALQGNPHHLSSYKYLEGIDRETSPVQQAMIYLNRLKKMNDVNLRGWAKNALGELKSVELLSFKINPPLTFKNQQDWEKIIRRIRGFDSAMKNCSKLAASIIYAAKFGKEKKADSSDATNEDYPYKPSIIIRSSSQTIKSENSIPYYYAAIKQNHLLPNAKGLTALLPTQLKYPESEGIIDCGAQAPYIDEKSFDAEYIHKDNFEVKLEKMAQEHGGWIIGTCTFSRIMPLTETQAEGFGFSDKRKSCTVDWEEFKNYSTIPGGHIMAFQYVSPAIAKKHNLPALMLFEPQALSGGKLKHGHNLIMDINKLPFINTTKMENLDGFDTYFTVIPFHSPSLSKGILPENVTIKTEFLPEASLPLSSSACSKQSHKRKNRSDDLSLSPASFSKAPRAVMFPTVTSRKETETTTHEFTGLTLSDR